MITRHVHTIASAKPRIELRHRVMCCRTAWLVGALFLITGCASTGVVSDKTSLGGKSTIEGFELLESQRVLSHGLTQIEERALDKPSIEKFVLSGLSGLADIDPLFSVVESDGKIRTYVGTILASELSKPIENGEGEQATINAWLGLFHGSLIGARRQSAAMLAADPEQIYNAFFDAALDQLDAYSRYSGRLQARANRETRSGFGGIGVSYVATDIGLEVQKLQPDAPARKAGIAVGDIITHVDGQSFATKRSWVVRRLLRGPIGSTSVFTVLRSDLSGAKAIPVIRKLIVPQTVEFFVEDSIAIIEIHSFNQRTSQTVERLLAKALTDDPAISGIILDLRGDPGGLLDQAVTVSDLFMENGRIVSTRGRHPESIQRYQAFEGDIGQGRPVIVLIDSRSASASEIVAAALQDSGRGLIVGTSSYGKGTVQTVVRLPNEGEITLTWSRFHAPDGYAIEDLGVLPMVCTSGLTGPADQILQNWRQSGSRVASLKAEWRTVAANDIAARAALRSHCPAEVRDENTIDLEVAKSLIYNKTLYAQAIGLTGILEAHQRP
ncbi:MAG: S41 family peptidase [Rhodospirillaceae bacterium]